jgi:hypothetical protein
MQLNGVQRNGPGRIEFAALQRIANSRTIRKVARSGFALSLRLAQSLQTVGFAILPLRQFLILQSQWNEVSGIFPSPVKRRALTFSGKNPALTGYRRASCRDTELVKPAPTES